MLRVLPGLELHAPSLDVPLEPESLRDPDDVQELPFLGEPVDRDLLSEQFDRKGAALFELLTGDSNFEQVRGLRARAGEQLRLRVDDQPDLVARGLPNASTAWAGLAECFGIRRNSSSGRAEAQTSEVTRAPYGFRV